MQPFTEPFHDAVRVAFAKERKERYKSKHNVSNIICAEPSEPLFSALEAKVWRKDDISGTKKHGEQRKPDCNDIHDAIILFHTHRLIPDAANHAAGRHSAFLCADHSPQPHLH